MPTATSKSLQKSGVFHQRRKKKAPSKSPSVATWGQKLGHLRGKMKGAPKDLSMREGFV
jgi:hypothetical protein